MKQLYSKTLLCLLALTLFFTGNVSAQLAGDFRSVASGDWNSVGTWETYNGATWAPATIIPNSATAIATVQAGHTLSVSGPVQVKTLKLDGIVTTTTVNTLTINYLGSIIGGSSTAYIDGPLNLQVTTGVGIPKDINVPLGKGSVGRPVVFRVGHNRANLVTYMLEMFNSAPPAKTLPATLNSVSSTRYYTIARTNVAGLTSNCNLTLRYDTDDAVGSNNSLLRIVRDGATAWTDLGGTGSAPVTGVITSVTPALLTPSLSLASPTNNVFTLALANSIISGNAGVAGATLTWVDGGVTKTTTSAVNGTYTIYVPGGWSGTITPSLQYYNFTPADMTYTSVSGNLTNQNYTAASIFTDFRSAGPGDWNDPLIWEGWDGTTWVPSSVPTGVAGSILIRAVDVVNVNVPVSLEAGCTLTNEGQLNVNGSLTVKANATLINIGLFGEPGGTLNVYGTLEHRQDGGMIGVAGNYGWTATNYYAGSKILVTGVINVAPTVPVQTSFQSMIWDCPNQADDVFLNINGIGGAPAYKDLYTGFGSLTVLNSNSKNIFMFSGQGRAVGNIVVDGPSSRVTAFTHTSTGIEYPFFSYFSSLTVQNGGQFYMTTNTGSGIHYVTVNIWNNLTVSSNSVLATYSNPGITGNSTALIGFAPNYPHTLDLGGQVPAPGLDAAANNLNFFIDGNSVTLASPIAVNSLGFSGTGRIISAGNLVTLLPGGAVSGESVTSFTDGPVAFQVATTDPVSLTFPVGKGSNGRPVILNVTQDAATPTTYTAEMMNPPVPANTLPSSLESVSAARYYDITKSAGANVTAASVLLNYSTDDGVTDNSLLRIAKADGNGNWVDLGGTGTAPETGTITSTNDFTDFTGSSFVLGTALILPKSITGNTGVADVTLSWYDAGVKTTVSDGNGDYIINVPPGWSGTVTPFLAGYSFTPASISFLNVLADQTQNFTPTALENVALNKPATSQGAQTPGYEPSKANDADGTNASYWNGAGYPKWWEVNLGGMYDLSSIVVRNWVDGSRYYQYTVEASADGQSWTEVAAKTSTDAATDAGDTYPVSVTAQYLRVNVTYHSNNTDVHITDFRAYGVLNTSAINITSSAGTGGTISPLGNVAVTTGSSQAFTITPATGYAVSDVLVDGVSQGALTSYTFTNVITGHTISATFTALENVALNKPATSQGAQTPGYEPSKANDADGTNASYWNGAGYPKWWEVNLGGMYDLSSIVVRNWVDGSRYYQYTVEASADGQTYTQVAAKTSTDAATDAGDTYPVSVTAQYLRVNMTYHSANPDVHITDFRAYGVLNASANNIISSAGTGGTISPLGNIAVTTGSSQAFTITPAAGYAISGVLVDGVSQGAVTSYTFNNVTAGHTISATFTALENVALNKPATSQGVQTAGYEPSKANDGDGTNASFWSGSGYPKWWEVNLGGMYDLSSIVVRNWVDGSRYYQYTVEASADGQTYTQVAAKTSTDAATDAGDTYPVSITAQYLRVNLTYHSANTDVHITDFRAYGVLNTSAINITSSAGTGGTISPLGNVAITTGSSQAFTITPAAGYVVSDVLVDGVSQGALTSYTFTNVTAGHTISATFTALENVALNKPATSQGAQTPGYEPSKANDGDGTNASFWSGSGYPQWWEVNLGGMYDLSSIVVRNWVDGSRYYQYTVEASADGQTYTQVAAKNSTDAATDAGDTYPVSVTAQYVRVNITYHSVNPDVHITDFRAYGVLNTSAHNITSSAGTGGTISPLGNVAVTTGSSQAFTITPAAGYVVSDVLVDGVSQGALTSYTFTNVTAGHTISATFTALENVALNKPATSQGAQTAGYEPSKANDGDGTNASFWSGSGYPQWWEVNLGGMYDLSSIVVRNWVDGSRYYQYTVEASADGQTYTQVAAKTSADAATDAGDTYPVSVTAQYLRVNMTYHSANTDVHITDFRAYGVLQSGAKGSSASVKSSGATVSNPSETEAIALDKKPEDSYLGSVKLNAYPNPFRDQVTVRIDSPDEVMFDVSVISLQGGSVHLKTQIPANTDNVLNLQLANGIYILRVNRNGILIRTQRIVKY